MGGGGVSVPGPSQEELALRREETRLLRIQTDAITEQLRVQNLLAPHLFTEAGLNPQFDEDGTITGFEPVDSELDVLRDDIERGFLERTNAALQGELPINPALTRSLEDEEVFLRERLLKDLGPGFETGTPGIEALGDFFERKESILEGARRDDLSLAESLGLAREGSNQARIDTQFNRAFGVSNEVAALSSNLPRGGFAGVASLFADDRSRQLQANIQNANNRSATLGSIFGAVGSVAGGFAGNAGIL